MLVIRRTLLLVTSAMVAYVQGDCASKFPVNTGHYCFKYIRERMTYSEATSKCNQMGAVVAHPAAQDWDTWQQDVRAVTRNDHRLWVGTERDKSGWYWLNTGYDGQPIAIDSNLRNQGDNTIPSAVWGGSGYKCKLKFGNETVANETMCNETMANSTMANSTMANSTMANSTMINCTSTDEKKEPWYCKSGTGNCATFGTNGRLDDSDCEDKNYVLCQGPVDYTSSCEDHNCTENAYHVPISFTLCGCKCRGGYLGDGYNHCDIDNSKLIWVILGVIVGSIIILVSCCHGVRKQMTTKSIKKDAVRKTWCSPALGIFVGILIIILCV